jgi:ParB family chromosome partitioning protein
MSRKVLGRGLEALIPDMKINEDQQREGLMQIPVSMIKQNRYQPRKGFDKEKLKELADSIREKGMIQPIIVQKRGVEYELIAGERRWRAVQMLGIEKVPALVREISDPEALELALIENIQRENLNPIEEALAYERLIREFNITQENLAKRVGRERSSITNHIRLLKLPEIIKEDLANSRLAMGHARALLGLESAKEQRTARDIVIKKELSVRETEALVRRIQKGPKGKKKAKKDIFLLSLEEELGKRLDTKVTINPGKRGGKIEIFYYSEEEFERLLEEIKEGRGKK